MRNKIKLSVLSLFIFSIIGCTNQEFVVDVIEETLVEDIKVATDLELIWQGSILQVVISKETDDGKLKSMHTSVIITPQKAIEFLQKIFPKIEINRIEIFLVNEGDLDIPYYRIVGINDGKFFNKNISYKVMVLMNAESGTFRSIERPEWSYFLK